MRIRNLFYKKGWAKNMVPHHCMSYCDYSQCGSKRIPMQFHIYYSDPKIRPRIVSSVIGGLYVIGKLYGITHSTVCSKNENRKMWNDVEYFYVLDLLSWGPLIYSDFWEGSVSSEFSGHALKAYVYTNNLLTFDVL